MKKNRITGLVGTFVLHAVLLALLLLMTISKPKAQEEGGVPVMLGNTEMAQGDADPYTMTEVDVLPEPEVAQPEPVVTPEPEVKQPMITQTEEKTIAVKKEQPKKEQPKKKEPVKKQEPVKKPVVKEPEMYVALYADEAVPYREIVNVLNIANENHFKMVLATRRPDTK